MSYLRHERWVDEGEAEKMYRYFRQENEDCGYLTEELPYRMCPTANFQLCAYRLVILWITCGQSIPSLVACTQEM